jgi:hypothetical protein
MFYLILSLIILGIAAALLGFLKKKEAAGNSVTTLRPEACCGRHAVCEHAGQLKANAACAADYYDDEELDRFRLRKANDYSGAETEEFRDVLHSLAKGEAEGWLKSLSRRGIVLPEALQGDAASIVAGDNNEGRS